MSFFTTLLLKLPAVLDIAARALDIIEDVQELGDDNKPKTDDRGQPVIKQQTRKVQPEEVFDFKVERETGVVRALTNAGQRVQGVLAAADIAQAILVSDGEYAADASAGELAEKEAKEKADKEAADKATKEKATATKAAAK
ncbi:hypothetical protein H5200_12080 [Pseudoalteromonas sp. SG43-7]|uniref:hypothetical protein n=1 Tax=Pseudoalteromonas sp. SG43-7 TaxID=2760966 RepID=UPI001603F0D6|nr:hypothetical protein [Pseudoalteromonas sp. SG43-7]MBB1422658.1 hypothetical protein [Pseudoalteromonas sp. SG43-7]